ncbi:MAG: hypothetical protein U0105_13565 [Candidatus Obscuribacterales bacterium]
MQCIVNSAETEVCLIVFEGLKERFWLSIEELIQLSKALERQVMISEDKVAARDLALLQLAVTACYLDAGDAEQARTHFQHSLGTMNRAGEVAAPLRPIALRLAMHIPLKTYYCLKQQKLMTSAAC